MRQPFFLLAHTSSPPVHPVLARRPRGRRPPPNHLACARHRISDTRAAGRDHLAPRRTPPAHARPCRRCWIYVAPASACRWDLASPSPREASASPAPAPPARVCLLHPQAAEPVPLPGLARWSRRGLLLCARAARRVRRTGEVWGRHRRKGLEGRRPGEPNLSTFQGESLESSFQELIPHPATRFIPLS